MKKIDLSKTAKKIESPLAKYSNGNLYCILCNSQVKSELFWTSHVNGKAHRDNLTNLKRKKAGESNEEPPSKKRISDANLMPPPNITNKALKSEKQVVFQAIESTKNQMILEAEGEHEFNRGSPDRNSMEVEEDEPMPSTKADLPEGFFDDPKEDAKARGKEFKDPEQVEWDKFMKEIAAEDLKSSELRINDEEESTKNRELDEIEEQMSHWQRLIQLEKVATQVKLREKKEVIEEEDDDLVEEEFDWRSKKSVTKQ